MDGTGGHRLQEVHHSQRRVELRNSHVGGGFLWGEALLGHEQPGRESIPFLPVVPVCYSVLTAFTSPLDCLIFLNKGKSRLFSIKVLSCFFKQYLRNNFCLDDLFASDTRNIKLDLFISAVLARRKMLLSVFSSSINTSWIFFDRLQLFRGFFLFLFFFAVSLLS